MREKKGTPVTAISELSAMHASGSVPGDWVADAYRTAHKGR